MSPLLYNHHCMVIVASIFFLPVASCFAIFNGKGGPRYAEIPLLDNCISKYPSEAQFCYEILDCIGRNVDSALAQRWSAGASILAFIPTILCLTSNSIDEITYLAEDSTLLAILLCLSSLTAFSSRFDFRTSKEPRNHREDFEASAQRVWDHIEDAVYTIGPTRNSWWQYRYVHTFGIGPVLLALSVATWYYLFSVTKYGVIVFACKVKFNVVVWAAATQCLGIINVLFRRQIHDIEKITLPLDRHSRVHAGFFNISRMASTMTTPLPLQDLDRINPGASAMNLKTTLDRTNFKDVVIILRSERNTRMRWALQFATAVLSIGLLSYGTVIFASTTLYTASDAIRVMVTVAFSAGFGRAVVSLLGSTSTTGKRMILIDVPADQLVRLSNIARETIGGI